MLHDFQFKFAHKYRISFNKRPQHLFNIEVFRGSAYLRVALKRGWWRVIFIKFENFVIVVFKITVKNTHYDTERLERLVIYIASIFVYLFHVHFI